MWSPERISTLWIVALDELDVLVDGVGGALVPLGLLGARVGRQHLHAAVGAVQTPGLAVADVLVQLQGLVLGQNAHGVNAGVDAVGQGEVDDPVLPAEGNGRLGGVLRQDVQTGALATGQQHGDTALFLEVHDVRVSFVVI